MSNQRITAIISINQSVIQSWTDENLLTVLRFKNKMYFCINILDYVFVMKLTEWNKTCPTSGVFGIPYSTHFRGSRPALTQKHCISYEGPYLNTEITEKKHARVTLFAR